MKVIIKYNNGEEIIESDYIQTHCDSNKLIIHGIDYTNSVELDKNQFEISIIIGKKNQKL